MKFLTYSPVTSLGYYELIHCSKHAPIGEVKRCINSAFRFTHPDNGGDPQVFALVIEAKDILLDPVARRIYDKTGLRKDKIIEIAIEYTQLLAAVYSAGLTNEQAYEALKEQFQEELEEIENKIKGIKKKIEQFRKVKEEIDEENFFTKQMIIFAEDSSNELDGFRRLAEEDQAYVLAKLEYLKVLKLKVTPVKTMYTNRSKTYSTYGTSKNSNYWR